LKKSFDFAELSEDQRRQYIDAEALQHALESAEEEAWRHRGSMFWRQQSGRNYLIRLWPDSRQNSLGVKSPQTEQTFERFTTRKARIEERLKQLREQASTTKRLNRALRVGRTPDVIIEVLNSLRKARVSKHFLLVGTNALYVYESAAGVRFPHEAMATRDADFLFDTRSRAEFLEVMEQRAVSFLDLLRKADKSFERDDHDLHSAVNSKGYAIEVIRRYPPKELEATEHPLRMTSDEGDLWAMRASTGERLLSVPRFSQVLVGTSGVMATASTVHPLAFARIKRQLSKDPKRSRLKASKDALQADMVQALVRDYLPHLSDEKAGSPS
jgi:hypothetical protein